MRVAWITREVLKNTLVRMAPTALMRLRGARGRGETLTDPDAVAAYCWDVFTDHATLLGQMPDRLFGGKSVIELGPGDNLGVGILALAHGAASYLALDRYGLLRQDTWARQMYARLLDRLGPTERGRVADRAIMDPSGLPRIGRQLGYTTDFAGAERLLGARTVDLIVSRAVLEHVHDLRAVMDGCHRCLRPGGLMIHKADLRDHSFRMNHPLDFLTLEPWLYRLMTGARGVHNRARRSDYMNFLTAAGFEILRMEEEHSLSPDDVEAARPRLAAEFRERPQSDLTCTVLFFAATRI